VLRFNEIATCSGLDKTEGCFRRCAPGSADMVEATAVRSPGSVHVALGTRRFEVGGLFAVRYSKPNRRWSVLRERLAF
jgi:hypothetical protein